MTLDKLKKLYLDCSRSRVLADRQRAEGYSKLIKQFSESKLKEISEDVKLSQIAENFYKESEVLYNTTKQEKYRWYLRAAKDCIINYASETEIQLALSKYTGNIDEKSIIAYLNTANYKNRIKYSTIHSVCNVMNLNNSDGGKSDN